MIARTAGTLTDRRAMTRPAVPLNRRSSRQTETLTFSHQATALPRSSSKGPITTVQAASYVETEAFPALHTYKVDSLDGTATKRALPL
jgi:hypothetical protein